LAFGKQTNKVHYDKSDFWNAKIENIFQNQLLIVTWFEID
jgi:hypothetical protein